MEIVPQLLERILGPQTAGASRASHLHLTFQDSTTDSQCRNNQNPKSQSLPPEKDAYSKPDAPTYWLKTSPKLYPTRRTASKHSVQRTSLCCGPRCLGKDLGVQGFRSLEFRVWRVQGFRGLGGSGLGMRFKDQCI